MILRLLLEDQESGFFVDVGAHHPERYSNTAYFHAKGWRGMNIDPDPKSIKMFEAERPGDTNLEVGIGEEEGEFEFTRYGERALSTFATERVEQLRREAPHYEVSEVVRAKVERLESILGEHLEPGQTIDFLNVDAEGRDIEVLRSNDWRRFRPRFVAVEIDVGFEDLAEHPTYRFMVEQGYRCVAKTPRTCFFQVLDPSVAR